MSGLTRATQALLVDQPRETVHSQEPHVKRSTATRQTTSAVLQPRRGERKKVRVPGRLTWRDASGTLRFVSVVTRDVSDMDAFVECQIPASIPLYRLVHFQIERPARELHDLPPALQQGKVLSAVYRMGPYKSSL